MWISRTDYHRALLGAKNDGRREGERLERDRSAGQRLAQAHWIRRSDVDWFTADPGGAIEAIREAAARDRRNADLTVARAERERDEAIAAADSREAAVNAREVDAAYQAGYLEGFAAGRRRPRGTPTP